VSDRARCTSNAAAHASSCCARSPAASSKAAPSACSAARSAHDAVELEGVRIEVARVIEDRVQALRLRFERSLDDPSLVLLWSGERGLSRLQPPPVGGMFLLPRANQPNWDALARSRYERRIGPLPAVLDYAPHPEFVQFEPK
jgi:hypothetical protein